MRTLALAFAVTLAALFGFTSTAGAIAQVDLVWVSTSNTDPAHTPLSIGVGTSAIMAHPGDHVGLEVLLTAGTEGISSFGISVAFNDQVQVLHTPTEFGLAPTITCTPFPGCFFDTPTLSNFTPGVSGVTPSGPATTGFVYTFEAGTLGSGLLGTFGPMKIGEIWFEVQSSVGTDGADVASGFFVPGVDAAYSNGGLPVAMNFGNAAVDLWGPEPGTATLLGLGLLGLTLAGRRNRK
jgi:hypothetical protein